MMLPTAEAMPWMNEVEVANEVSVEEAIIAMKSVLEAKAADVEAMIESSEVLVAKASTRRLRATMAEARFCTDEEVPGTDRLSEFNPAWRSAVLEAKLLRSEERLLNDSLTQVTLAEQRSPVILRLPTSSIERTLSPR